MLQKLWIILTVLVGTLFTSTCGASEWVRYGIDQMGDMQYDRDSVRQSSTDTLIVWTRLVYSEEGKRRYISSLGPDKLSRYKYDELRNSDTLVEMDCRIRKAKLLLVEDYDTKGAPLYSGDLPVDLPSPWYDIEPKSVADELRGIVCAASAITSGEGVKGTTESQPSGASSSEPKRDGWIRIDEQPGQKQE